MWSPALRVPAWRGPWALEQCSPSSLRRKLGPSNNEGDIMEVLEGLKEEVCAMRGTGGIYEDPLLFAKW